jgi:PadR family transcriptional regulator PadR
VAESSSEAIDRWSVQLRKGCLNLAVLASLWRGPLYGLEILRHLATTSNLVVPEGTVYPLLSRMRAEGWVDSRWVASDAGHPRRYYELTDAGRDHVRRMVRAWSSFVAGVDDLLTPIHEEAQR